MTLIVQEDNYYKITCPFCASSTSSTNDEFGIGVVKDCTARHLAKRHREQMTSIAKQRVKRGDVILGGLLNG